MYRFINILCVLWFFFYQVHSGSSQEMNYASNRIIVKFTKDALLKNGIHNIIPQLDFNSKRVKIKNLTQLSPLLSPSLNKISNNSEIDQIMFLEFKPDDLISIDDIITELENNPNVIYAEPDYVGILCETPNDPLFSHQWALNRINAAQAWNIQTGNNSIIVGILDTGLEIDHIDLASNVYINTNEIPGDSIDNDGNGYVDDVHGWDFVSVDSSKVASGEDPFPPDNNVDDFMGHGTNVAGIIGAVTNNYEGIAGLCWNCRLLPVRCGYLNNEGEGNFLLSDLEKAIVYAVKQNAKVLNMSLGSYSISESFREVLNYASQNDVLLVAAAGNDDSEELFYPAADSLVLSVAGTQYNDEKSWFSNFGHWIDVSAPSIDICTTSMDNNYIDFFSGTSAAAPFVSGLCALLLSNFPQDNIVKIKNRLVSTSDMTEDFSSPNFSKMGTGRINAFSALDAEPSPHILFTNLSHKGRNNENYISKGDTLEIGISIKNYWEPAPELFCTIEISDPRLTGINPSIYIGNLKSNEVFNNEKNPFLVLVNDDIGEVVQVPLSFKLNSSFPYSKTIEASILINPLYDIQTGYPVRGGFDPLCLDFDNDGTKEYVFASCCVDYNNNIISEVNMVGYDQSMKPGWPVKIPFYAGAISAGDITGNGFFEIVFISGTRLYVLDHEGNKINGFPKKSVYDFHGPMIEDINRDGSFEIIATSNERIYVFDKSGKIMSGWPKPLGRITGGHNCRIASADLDNDGYPEIIAAFSRKIRVWHADGTVMKGWDNKYLDDYFSRGDILVGNINFDDKPEIILKADGLTALDTKGREVYGFPVYPDKWDDHLPGWGALGDLDKDGALEIIMISGEYLYAYTHGGRVFNQTYPLKVSYENYRGPSVSNIYGDGLPEILYGDGDGYLYIIKGNGELINGFPQKISNSRISQLQLGDYDDDGDIDLIFGAGQQIFAYDFKAPLISESNQWSIWGHDARRSGNFTSKMETEEERRIRQSLPSSFKLYQNYPNPYNVVTTIKYAVLKYCKVTLKLYDIRGREIANLVNAYKNPGTYTVRVNAKTLASGLYFYRMQADNYTETRKLILIQ